MKIKYFFKDFTERILMGVTLLNRYFSRDCFFSTQHRAVARSGQKEVLKKCREGAHIFSLSLSLSKAEGSIRAYSHCKCYVSY